VAAADGWERERERGGITGAKSKGEEEMGETMSDTTLRGLRLLLESEICTPEESLSSSE